MASLKQITVGTTSYDIIPSAITDSNANYKASCPTISSDTTVEVASNKTTVINSSSTDTEYPSARAVYTAIKKASKAGTFASNISTSNGSSFVPLISTSGMFSTTYLENLSIPDNKRMYLTNAGTISTLTLANPSPGVSGKITKFYLDHGTAIGDSTTSTESDTTLGCNGLYGNGTVYIAATCTNDPTTSPYAFKGSIINKAGASGSVQGGYIGSINNNAYATINKIQNASSGNITNIENSGTIYSIVNTGIIQWLNLNSGAVNAIVENGSTASLRIGSARNSQNSPWNVVESGKINPWQEVSNITDLVSLLNAQTGILYKYTGSTTTYNGVTYTNGNFYRYEA